MYILQIENTIKMLKQITILDGEQIIDREGTPLEIPKLDEQGKIILNQDMNEVMTKYINNTGLDIIVEVFKKPSELESERQTLINNKTLEIQTEINVYKSAQEYQAEHGGPGAIAQFEIMEIVNGHDGEFQLIIKDI